MAADSGDRLVESSLGVAEIACQRRVRNDATAHFVRHQDHRPLRPGEGFAERLAFCLDPLPGHVKIRQPQGQAINKNEAPGIARPVERPDKVERFLDRHPVGRACGPVGRDARCHFCILRLAGDDYDRQPGTSGENGLCIGALSGTGTADHEQGCGLQVQAGSLRNFTSFDAAGRLC